MVALPVVSPTRTLEDPTPTSEALPMIRAPAPLAALLLAALAACTAPAAVGDPAEPVERFAARVARAAQAGLLDSLGGPGAVLDAMRGDAGAVESRGLRFRTFSTAPSTTDVIHTSFADYCAARGGTITARPNAVTLPAPTRAGTQRRRTTFRFCEPASGGGGGGGGGAPLFAYSVFDTGERMETTRRVLITVATDPRGANGAGPALAAFARSLAR